MGPTVNQDPNQQKASSPEEVQPVPTNTTTKVIQTGIKYSLLGQKIDLVFYALIYLVVFIPGTLYISSAFSSSSKVIATIIRVIFIGLPPIGFIINLYILRRRNWAASQQPDYTPSLSPDQINPTAVEPLVMQAQPISPADPILEPKLELSIPGIIKSGIDSSGIAGVQVGVQHPENTLLVTDQALCFIYVPMPGADNQYMNTQYLTSMFDKKGIEEALNNLLSTKQLSQIINMDSRNWILRYADINNLHLSNFQKTLKVETKGGDKRTYVIGDKNRYQQLQQLLASKGYT